MGATVVDIKTKDITSIPENEIFAVDTNVLAWTHYSKASDPSINKHPYQVIEYPNFVSRLISNGNKIVTTNLNITELINVTERNEYKIYKAVNHSSISFKQYRILSNEREKYKSELDTMMLQIKTTYAQKFHIVDISEQIIDEYRKNILNNVCDVFDYIIINYLKEKGITNFISDDKDYLSIDGISLYTTYGSL